MAKKTQNIVYRENIITQSVNVVCKFMNMGRQDSKNGYYYKPHIHEEFEILYIISGTLTPKINGVDVTVKEGETYFLQPGQTHEEFSDSNFVSFYYIKCNFYRIDGKVAYLTNNIQDQIINSNKKEFKKLFEDMFKEVQNKKLGYWQILESTLVKMFCNLLRCNTSLNSTNYEAYGIQEYKQEYSNPTINLVIEYMKANEHRILSMEELAHSASVSTSHLHYLFKKYLNMSPIKYMMTLKMDGVKLMLVQTDLPTKSIAQFFGFEDYSYFCKVFKRYCDVTPLEYKTQFTKGIKDEI